jgi:hypothetical protein
MKSKKNCQNDCKQLVCSKKNIQTQYKLENILIQDPESIDLNGNYLVKPNTFATYTKNLNVSNPKSIYAPFTTNGSNGITRVTVIKYGPGGTNKTYHFVSKCMILLVAFYIINLCLLYKNF